MSFKNVDGTYQAEGLERLAVNANGFDFSILRYSGFWRAADEAVFNKVYKKNNPKKSPFFILRNVRSRWHYLQHHFFVS